MPRNSKNKKKGGRRGNGGGSRSIDNLIVRSNRASALTVTVPEDLASMPKSWTFNESPPKNFLSQIHWFQLTFDSLVTTSTTIPTEVNQACQLSTFNGSSNLTAVFDQYACYCFTVTITPWNNMSVANNLQVWTALDYDNAAAIGVSGIEQFGSCNLSVLSSNGSVERFVKPCADPSLYSGGFGAGRFWVDSGSPSVYHYGIRTILGPTTGAQTVEISMRAIFAARSTI
jgi:hypothetical protein